MRTAAFREVRLADIIVFEIGFFDDDDESRTFLSSRSIYYGMVLLPAVSWLCPQGTVCGGGGE